MKQTALLLLLLASVAAAQTPLEKVTVEPQERDTFSCRFSSWELTAAGITCATNADCTAIASNGICTAALVCVFVNVISPPAKPDAAPGAIIVAGPSRTTNDVSVTVHPDEGCAAVSCRNGNSYQIRLQPLGEAHSGVFDAPTCNFIVAIKKVTP